IGFRALVSQDNSLVLGGITGFNSGTDTKVGIGTTTPGVLLDVQRDQNTITETARFTTYGADNKILTRASGGTRTTPTATPNNTLLLQLGATGHNGNGFVTAPRAAIEMAAAEAWAPGAAGTLMRFNTTATGTTQILTRMTIADDGNIGIGTSAPNTFKLQVAGSVGPNIDNSADLGDPTHRWTKVFATIGTIQTSDVRLKQQITELGYGLSEVLRLRPVSFAWKDQ